MIVRYATNIDAGAIARVHVASWQAAYRDILPSDYLANLPVAKRQEIWEKSILGNMSQILVAEFDGQVVGFSAIGPCRDDGADSSSYEIWALYAAPSHWSLGVGRELWLGSRDALLARGAKSISLWVFADNERAIGFYRAAGFSPVAGSRKQVELGGVTIEKERHLAVF